MLDTLFRSASAADCEALAALHLRSWRASYRGALPDGYLDGELAADIDRHWRNAFNLRGDGMTVLMAERSGRPAGFVVVWPSAQAAASARIDALHVAPDQRGDGLGRALLGETARLLVADDYRSAYQWVLAENTVARNFCERLGGTAVEQETKPVGRYRAEQVRYVWRDLRRLTAVCRAHQPA